MKKQIGWVLKPEFKYLEEAACKISGLIGMNKFTYLNRTNFENTSLCRTNVEAAGVLELWFNPVFEETLEITEPYNIGDYIFCKKDFPMINANIVFCKGNVYKSEKKDSIIDEDGMNHYLKYNNTFNNGTKFSDYFRKASEEEIKSYKPIYSNVFVSGVNVKIFKDRIEVEERTISIESLESFKTAIYNFNKQNIGTFPVEIRIVKVGCSMFDISDLELLLEAYYKFNQNQ